LGHGCKPQKFYTDVIVDEFAENEDDEDDEEDPEDSDNVDSFDYSD